LRGLLYSPRTDIVGLIAQVRKVRQKQKSSCWLTNRFSRADDLG